jgi:thioester reductase-like protein
MTSRTTDVCGLSPTESVILSAAGSTLRRPLTADDVAVPLSILGADSLAVIELTAAVEDTLGVTIPPELAHESTTIRALGDWIDAQPRPAPAHPVAHDPFDQMISDSVLPQDVWPTANPRVGPTFRSGANRPVNATFRSGADRGGLLDGRAILLTGATGFLGARLAADLLARSDARLYCTVREGRGQPGERLRHRLIEHGVSTDAIAGRVEIVEADLTRPRLGLGFAAWRRLGETVDRVLHAGASVNWIAPYGSLRAANVLGTLELLRLACQASPIPFHFVSSLSACYAVDGPPSVDETFDPLPHLRGVHLGYAQTKVVAEALVREAGRRGLPVTIYRPSLIAGHSKTGAFNADDLLSLLIRGCIRMGAAPDLDWALDCEPVDVVSAGILALANGCDDTVHLKHLRPRHWRECLLWMRLAGYDVRLVPYAEWLAELERDVRSAPEHPLRSLRSFFLNRPAGARGLTLPELYENGRRSTVSAARTDARLAGSIERPALDASLLDCYFDAYRAAGYLPAPASADANRVTATTAFDEAFFESALSRPGLRVRSATCLSAGSEHSIISELTAWRSRQPAGLFRYRLELDTEGDWRTGDVVVKVKPHSDDATAVGEAVARICDVRVGDTYARWRDRVGLAGSHLRERALYERDDVRLRQHMPALLGALDLDGRGSCALVLEDVSGATRIDSTDRAPWWRPDEIEIVVRALADVHAASYGRSADLRGLPWIGFCQSAESMSEMADLWRALADHAAPAFAQWGGGDLPALHRALVDSIDEWRPVIDHAPQALIHNDFNPRNLCLRDGAAGLTLCAYDWELATIGAPQRDLAEFLCFVLPATVTDGTIDRWVERHRDALERASGETIDRAAWQRGFQAAMNDLLVNRLAMYALVHRIRRQSFLPRVVASWARIHARAGAVAMAIG